MKTPVAMGEYVVVRQTVTVKEKKIILVGTEAEKNNDIKFEIVDIGKAVPNTHNFKIGDVPVFTKHMSPLSVAAEVEPDEKGNGSMFIIIHFESIIAIEG